MQFGGTADAAASQAMFEACKEAGINFFDTAHTYTGGSSERMLGQFAKLDREKLIVATKAGYTGGSGRNNIIRQFDESRIRLGLDTVDILYLHRWDPETPLQETFETLEALQRSGKIRYIGVSNFAAWQVMKAQAAANIVGTRIDIIQPMYSLVKRQAEVELFPMALSEEIAVAPYSPLGSGLLTGKYFSGGAGRLSTDKRYAARYGQKWMLDAARALSELAAELSIDTATLSVAWAAQNAAVTAPIISARNVEQLKPSLDAKDVMLSAAVYARMEALSPRPAPATDRLEEASS
ncbi:aryl-alcohol dehydrogenase-like predicted oxidoreductase [Pelagimonas varians]|uniref:L-glyceraldehyde 3-phosphate reductase n=2 Tax=Rhodobacterales TaxID=204455 RepID=A0A238KZZ1_9RHOB|nr:aryl-alcohol dehydrogenase-like predicted oxidoreductase [Pelagimonas varians]SMX48190.1 L-glyceraldehyde 3-phosphate reductase [Pelagimonas varians]